VTAACLLPLALRLLGAHDAVVLTGVVVAALLLFSHRANIRRLLDGTERRLGRKDTR
jgi:glycerol-3-phosphate acyltransferase PlsY